MSERNETLRPVSDDDRRRAKIPHELFLTNLIGNHILAFVATLGIAGNVLWPLLCVPVVSLLLLTHTLARAHRARRTDPWFVMVHWQLAARRSLLFLAMLGLLTLVAGGAWFGYEVAGMRKETAIALAGGLGMLPTMVTVLVLIVMESDALYQAMHGRLPASLLRRYPQPAAE